MNGFEFIETSAKNADVIEETFQKMAKTMKERNQLCQSVIKGSGGNKKIGPGVPLQQR